MLALREEDETLRVPLLKAVDPTAVLARGYSITMDEAGKVIRESKTLQKGQRVRTVLDNGKFTSTVESTA